MVEVMLVLGKDQVLSRLDCCIARSHDKGF